MRAGPPPLLTSAAAAAVVLVVTVVAPVVVGRDVEFLQTMQREEASIDKLISEILKLQEVQELARWNQQQWDQRQWDQQQRDQWQRGQQQWDQQQRDQREWDQQQRDQQQRDHPPRQFAYYPSDPEYRAPRHHQTQTAQQSLSDPGRVELRATIDGSQTGGQKTGNTGRVLSSLHAGAQTKTASTDQEDIPLNDVREKRPMATIDLAGRTEALHDRQPGRDKMSDIYFIVTVVGVCTGTVCVTILGGFCYRHLQRSRRRSSSESSYPSYGVTGPHPDLSPAGAERKLAQSAQLYHYQHQKQQMMAIEEGKTLGQRSSPSDEDSDDEDGESEHTVYECPGLAPSGEMEVKNPLFNDDPTPRQSVADSDDQ